MKDKLEKRKDFTVRACETISAADTNIADISGDIIRRDLGRRIQISNIYSMLLLAEDLIRRDGAYVCHCSKSEIAQQRGGGKGATPRYACCHRNHPIDESLAEFRAMRDGKYGPQEALLRMKQDLGSNNPQMWDLTAYRVIQLAKSSNVEEAVGGEIPDSTIGIHYRTGDKWKIYPTYDFTHCLVDSLEGITHSLCTTEFETARTSYNWLCDTLGVYRPMQREYGRLNLSGTVLSKRKIMDLISKGHVRDWDDPRLYTLIALRRRGIPLGAILSDFRETPSKDFFRLTPGTSVGLLKVPFPITATTFEKDPDSGLVTLVHAKYDKPAECAKFKKPKAPVKACVRIHNFLFTCDNPDTHPDGFLSVVNPQSEEVYPNAMIDIGLEEITRRAPWPKTKSEEMPTDSQITPESVRFQGMRVAYFCLDPDSTADYKVLNRIVSLKEDTKK
ncbi:glutaminyl-tRNA synthetase, putative [Talaromyces stipitatus ATCC 10500]|uniref:glutamine--tRNA ligase n=1 Tax=Talaromyces stipitatus (strain ATCC 10500 / CBS 375.48 / QM 6759 / NRRL 1006) TaxID=441959 RepID=B8M893_TALSN|nr:glutaminyl-tRNA synthetase, putative [Talaromyces stipitatus ATCC 10500]EED20406.1 glutaminyl-tRNA synthetase, putative [Talaromyces stipitatus ATCC 10500]